MFMCRIEICLVILCFAVQCICNPLVIPSDQSLNKIDIPQAGKSNCNEFVARGLLNWKERVLPLNNFFLQFYFNKSEQYNGYIHRLQDSLFTLSNYINDFGIISNKTSEGLKSNDTSQNRSFNEIGQFETNSDSLLDSTESIPLKIFSDFETERKHYDLHAYNSTGVHSGESHRTEVHYSNNTAITNNSVDQNINESNNCHHNITHFSEDKLINISYGKSSPNKNVFDQNDSTNQADSKFSASLQQLVKCTNCKPSRNFLLYNRTETVSPSKALNVLINATSLNYDNASSSNNRETVYHRGMLSFNLSKNTHANVSEAEGEVKHVFFMVQGDVPYVNKFNETSNVNIQVNSLLDFHNSKTFQSNASADENLSVVVSLISKLFKALSNRTKQHSNLPHLLETSNNTSSIGRKISNTKSTSTFNMQLGKNEVKLGSTSSSKNIQNINRFERIHDNEGILEGNLNNITEQNLFKSRERVSTSRQGVNKPAYSLNNTILLSLSHNTTFSLQANNVKTQIGQTKSELMSSAIKKTLPLFFVDNTTDSTKKDKMLYSQMPTTGSQQQQQPIKVNIFAKHPGSLETSREKYHAWQSPSPQIDHPDNLSNSFLSGETDENETERDAPRYQTHNQTKNNRNIQVPIKSSATNALFNSNINVNTLGCTEPKMSYFSKSGSNTLKIFANRAVKRLERINRLHMAAELLLATLPRSKEEIVEALQDELFEDSIFAPEGRSIFEVTGACPVCYMKDPMGRCRKIMFCRSN